MRGTKYLKLFNTHTEYQSYMAGTEKDLPNVCYCEDNNDVHYNQIPKLVAEFNVTDDYTKSVLYFEDFPDDICDDEYGGDMEAFKQECIDDVENYCVTNGYFYTGETFEYDGNEYYLWENMKMAGAPPYLLTDTLDFTGKSLEEDIDSDYCPFVYLLDEDKEVIYDNEDHGEYWLVATRQGSPLTIAYDTSLFSSIEIDGVVQPSVVSSYTFDTAGKHTVKYTLSDPTEIGEMAFYQCTNLTSVTIGNSVTSIGSAAFDTCTSLTSVIIPNSVTSIGYGAFRDCSGLASVTIPDSVTSIGGYAFDGCNSLTSVTVEATTPPTLEDYAFYNNASGRKIYVPSASVATYKAASGWVGYSSSIEAIP